MEYIKKFLETLDPSVLLPDLNQMLDKVHLLVRISVLIGPLVLMILGLIYLLLPPKEANHSLGYQFFWGKSSVECWRFTQRLAGFAWSVLGLVLLVVMYFISNGFAGKEAMDMISAAAHCILWELVLIAVCCLVVDVLVMVVYDSKGRKRKDKKKSL